MKCSTRCNVVLPAKFELICVKMHFVTAIRNNTVNFEIIKVSGLVLFMKDQFNCKPISVPKNMDTPKMSSSKKTEGK